MSGSGDPDLDPDLDPDPDLDLDLDLDLVGRGLVPRRRPIQGLSVVTPAAPASA